MTVPAANLFRNVPNRDVLGFGQGTQFQPQRVSEFLDLKKADVSRVADVSPKSVRWDDAIPAAMRNRLEEIAATCNLVAEAFGGDVEKTALWFKAKNPLLGDVSPRDMVRLGRFDRLRKYIVSAVMERAGSTAGSIEQS
ncbi:MAG: hypothetical protein U1A73_19905 [Pseudomonas sp.]|nr:hypothetical protein [Xanthomonadaceae bacterium]MDP2186680.1 hypothetical protein [Xanthomonadales bacterium]MDZ4115690.1 hypothetical protein [Xanthomonadaceae bacterium]MDZ4327264.1 hypothetical protein [Pseudomonas sp.]